MVYVTPEQYDDVYQKLVQDAHSHQGTVLVLVSSDPDALCALKILLALLKDDSVAYHLIPVSGPSDLARVNRLWFESPSTDHTDSTGPNWGALATSLRSIVCLNCGALTDILETFQLPEHVTVYIFDSHRPYCLDNLFRYPQLVIFDDGDVDQSLDLVRQAFLRLTEQGADNSDPGDSSDNDSLAEEHPPVNNNAGKKRARSPHNSSFATSPTSVLSQNTSSQSTSPPARRRRTGMASDVPVPKDSNPDSAEMGEDDPEVDENQLHMPLRMCRRIIAEYYSRGNFYGQSTAVTLYMLALQLSRENADMLWYAIVGLTYQYLFDHINEEDYWGQIQIYNDEVDRLFPNAGSDSTDEPSPSTGDESGRAKSQPQDVLETLFGGSTESARSGEPHLTSAQEDASREVSNQGLSQTNPADPSNQPPNPAQLAMKIKRVTQPHGIEYSEEFKFMLLRHWSLYDSMHYSRYLATRLGIWSDRGRRLLSLMLAKMGFSLSDAHQVYIHMSPENKARLRIKLDQVAPDYGCEDLVFPSFVRSFGWGKGAKLAAGDVVYGLVALLKGAGAPGAGEPTTVSGAAQEDTTGAISRTSSQSTATATPGEQPLNSWKSMVPWRDASDVSMGTTDPAGPLNWSSGTVQATDGEYDGAWLRGFFTAYDSLSNLDLLQSGIQLAMKFQQAIVQQGVSIIERRSIKTLRSFRLAVLTDTHSLFHHPLTLNQLALFLMDALKNSRKHKQTLPFVVASMIPSRNVYLVAGLAGDAQYDSVRAERNAAPKTDRCNPFGVAFQETAHRTGARLKHDSFESSVVEISGPDLLTFIEYLHLYL
ncbi:DNA replication initiation factor cdc45 [Dispira simplex]|nr:DNA replication initiation factor cdc45 [Dispira simplex]